MALVSGVITSSFGGGAGIRGITKAGDGLLKLTGANTYTGNTTVTGGLIEINSTASTGAASNKIVLNGGGVRWATGYTGSIASRLDPIGASGGTFDTNGNDVTFASAISGSGPVTKTGAGSLILNGTHTWTGATFVNSGTLQVNGSIATSSLTTVGASGTLSGTGTVGSTVINGTFAPGNSPGLFTVSGNLTLLGSTQIELAGLTRGTTYDATNVTGTLTFGGTLDVALLSGFNPIAGDSFNLFDWSGGASGTFSALNLPTLGTGLAWNTANLYSTGELSISAVPEPSTYAALFGAGALGLAFWWRRKQQQRI